MRVPGLPLLPEAKTLKSAVEWIRGLAGGLGQGSADRLNGDVRLWTFFALMWVGPPAARADPSVSEIIAKTLQNDEARQRALPSTRYDQTATIDQLDSRERVTRHNFLIMIMSPGSNPPMKVTAVCGEVAPPLGDRAAVQGMVEDVEGNKATFTLRYLADLAKDRANEWLRAAFVAWAV